MIRNLCKYALCPEGCVPRKQLRNGQKSTSDSILIRLTVALLPSCKRTDSFYCCSLRYLFIFNFAIRVFGIKNVCNTDIWSIWMVYRFRTQMILVPHPAFLEQYVVVPRLACHLDISFKNREKQGVVQIG